MDKAFLGPLITTVENERENSIDERKNAREQ